MNFVTSNKDAEDASGESPPTQRHYRTLVARYARMRERANARCARAHAQEYVFSVNPASSLSCVLLCVFCSSYVSALNRHIDWIQSWPLKKKAVCVYIYLWVNSGCS